MRFGYFGTPQVAGSDIVPAGRSVRPRQYAENNAVFNVRDFGAAGDGVTNDTTRIQEAINAALFLGGGRVRFPAGTYMVDGNADPVVNLYGGLKLYSGIMLELDPGAVLQALPTAHGVYAVVHTAENATRCGVRGGTIRGEADTHNPAGGGEWGHGIIVSHGASHVTIEGTKLTNCWGDGLYIGKLTEAGTAPSFVTVTDVISDGNRRQGVSVTGADSVTFVRTKARNTGRALSTVAPFAAMMTLPAAGWDLEPDGEAINTNIRLIDCDAENNYGPALNVSGHGNYGLRVTRGRLAGSADSPKGHAFFADTTNALRDVATFDGVTFDGPITNHYRCVFRSCKGTIHGPHAASNYAFRDEGDTPALLDGCEWRLTGTAMFPFWANSQRGREKVIRNSRLTLVGDAHAGLTAVGAMQGAYVLDGVTFDHEGAVPAGGLLRLALFDVGALSQLTDVYVSPVLGETRPFVGNVRGHRSLRSRVTPGTAPTAGTYEAGDVYATSAATRGRPALAVCTAAGTPGSWAFAAPVAGVSTYGDVNRTLTLGTDGPVCLWTAPLTGGRIAALDSANAYDGAMLYIARTATATGAATLSVANLVGGAASIVLAVAEWCLVVYRAGAGWMLLARGSLDVPGGGGGSTPAGARHLASGAGAVTPGAASGPVQATLTIPGGTLAPGGRLVVKAYSAKTGTNGGYNHRVRFGSTITTATVAAGTDAWHEHETEIAVIATGAGGQLLKTCGTRSTGTINSVASTTASEDLSAAIVVNVECVAVSSGDSVDTVEYSVTYFPPA